MDYISPGFSVHGITQARKLKWDAIPSPGYLSDPGIKPPSPAMAGGSFSTETREAHSKGNTQLKQSP